MFFRETFIHRWRSKMHSTISRYLTKPLKVLIMNGFFRFKTFGKIRKIRFSHKYHDMCLIIDFNKWKTILINRYEKLIIVLCYRNCQRDLISRREKNPVRQIISTLSIGIFPFINKFTFVSLCRIPNAIRVMGLLIKIGAEK